MKIIPFNSQNYTGSLYKIVLKAQAWADNLGSTCQFYHSQLGDTPGAMAENIASVCGAKPPGTMPVEGWKKSPGHRKNVRMSK